ncbi:MAG: hypothetical protein HY815_14150 [Candidatus Riflebacteria bacterium]|nr:hypothetical protein [Candidatus Riflebacteria bacterium]
MDSSAGGTVDVGACLSYGVEKLQKNMGFQVIAGLLISLINSCCSGLLIGPLWLGYFMALKKEDSGKTPEVGDVFEGFNIFLPAFLAGLLGLLVVTVGICLCIIPGLLVAPIIPVSLYLIPLQTAWTGVQRNLMSAALANFVLGIVAGAGALACGIGILFTAPIALAGMYKMSQQIAASCDGAAKTGV